MHVFPHCLFFKVETSWQKFPRNLIFIFYIKKILEVQINIKKSDIHFLNLIVQPNSVLSDY